MKLTQRKRKACVVFEFEFLDLGGSFDSRHATDVISNSIVFAPSEVSKITSNWFK